MFVCACLFVGAFRVAGLSFNSIKEWRAFPSLPALTTLDLQGNAIETMKGFVIAAPEPKRAKQSKLKGDGKRRKASGSNGDRKSRGSSAQQDTAKPSAAEKDGKTKTTLFPELDLLDLRDNRLRDIRGFDALAYCAELSELHIAGNPVCEKINFEANILKRVSQVCVRVCLVCLSVYLSVCMYGMRMSLV